MAASDQESSFEVEPSREGERLDAVLRDSLAQPPWSRVRGWIASGKVFVDDRPELDPGCPVRTGQRLELRLNAPKPQTQQRLASDAIVFLDAHVVVVRKPAGISSVPYEPGERGTLQELVRAWLNRTAASRRERGRGDLGVVHRIDKETSGLLVFTRSLDAKRGLDQQMRDHSVERRYFAIAHGGVQPRTIESRIVANRGDGVRGSTRDPRLGQRAVTHVAAVEALSGATLISCRLETGRTHQIRIHLSEAGHPLLGERVYTRGHPGPFLPAPRVMLHAAVLGFVHPVRGNALRFEEPIPDDMQRVIRGLREP